MSCILHIETSTSACSVAVSEDGQNVFKKEDLNGPSHAVSLGIFVDEALSFADSHALVRIPGCVSACRWQKVSAMDVTCHLSGWKP